MVCKTKRCPPCFLLVRKFSFFRVAKSLSVVLPTVWQVSFWMASTLFLLHAILRPRLDHCFDTLFGFLSEAPDLLSFSRCLWKFGFVHRILLGKSFFDGL